MTYCVGFTRDFLDGKVSTEDLVLKIQRAHANLMRESAFVVCEGTGHTGVGSICEVNNAQVAGMYICMTDSYPSLNRLRHSCVGDGCHLCRAWRTGVIF